MRRVFEFGKWEVVLSLDWDWSTFGIAFQSGWGGSGFAVILGVAFWSAKLDVYEPLLIDLDDPIVED